MHSLKSKLPDYEYDWSALAKSFSCREACLPCVCLIALRGRGVWFLTPVSWLLCSLARNSFCLYLSSQTVVAKLHWVIVFLFWFFFLFCVIRMAQIWELQTSLARHSPFLNVTESLLSTVSWILVTPWHLSCALVWLPPRQDPCWLHTLGQWPGSHVDMA